MPTSNYVVNISAKKNIWNFFELFEYRYLIKALVARDIKVKYKQTVLGIFWVLFQPLLTAIILSAVFSRAIPIEGLSYPYFLFVFTAVVFWNYFATSLSQASESLIQNEVLVKKVFFPRLILPLTPVIANSLDFLVGALLLIATVIYFRVDFNLLTLLAVLLLLFATGLTAFSLGMGLSAINAKYRDVRFVLPFFVQLLIFVSPIIYPSKILGSYEYLSYINPISSVIMLSRKYILGYGDVNPSYLLVSLVSLIVIFAVSFLYFKRTEKYFADLI